MKKDDTGKNDDGDSKRNPAAKLASVGGEGKGENQVERTESPPEKPPKKGRPQTPRERWNRSGLPNQLNAILAFLIALMTLVNVGFFVKQVIDQDRQVEGIRTAITTGIGDAKVAVSELISQNKISLESSLRENRSALEAMMEANRQQADANLRASLEQGMKTLKQGQRAMDTTIETSRIDLRPWLVVQSCRLSAEPMPDVAISAECEVVNTGKTPAIDAYPQHDLRGVDGIPPKVTRQMVRFGVPTDFASRTLVAPGGRAPTFTTDPYTLNAAGVTQYKEGRATLFINAIIRYRDTFGIPHWTTYCAYHLATQRLTQVNSCSGGNEADHNQATSDPVGPPGSDK